MGWRIGNGLSEDRRAEESLRGERAFGEGDRGLPDWLLHPDVQIAVEDFALQSR